MNSVLSEHAELVNCYKQRHLTESNDTNSITSVRVPSEQGMI